jgi:HAD superfamily hydrolase (TIGR01509 family)
MEHGLPEGVVAVIRRGDGAYLFIQRAAHESFGGYWCPVSGRVEAGESHAQAAVREAREEVDIEIRPVRRLHEEASTSGAFWLRWWLCEHVAGEPRVAAPDEIADTRWVRIEDVQRLQPHFAIDVELMLRIERELGTPRPCIIFFDLGCTLVDEDPAHRVRLAQASRLLSQRGLRVSVEELWQESERASGAFARYPIVGALVRLGVAEDEAHALRAAAAYDHRHERLYPGVADLLAKLAGSFRLGVIANQSLGTEQRMREHGIRDFFSVVAASAELELAKPDLAIFRWALERAGCAAADALMVGDRLDNDIAPAKRLGMRTVRVRQGIARGQAPRTAEETPDFTIDAIADLAGVLP